MRAALFIILLPVAVLAGQVFSVWFLAKVALVAFASYLWRLHKEAFE